MKILTLLLCLFLCSSVSLPGFGQVPLLTSHPAAGATIYMDFDGQYISGSSWNWGGPIDANPSGLPEQAITEIFNRVAEDYRPFDLTLTTDSNVYKAAPIGQRIRLIITPTSEWYGLSAGVAYVGSFNWGDDTPAWVFSNLLFDNSKYIAEACSHELGHTLGLQHQSEYEDCYKIKEYNEGSGEGQIGWAPIMGVGYYRNLTTWHLGPSTIGCDVIQDDLMILAGNVGIRRDDHANDPAAATKVNMREGDLLIRGEINKLVGTDSADVDFFSFTINNTTNIKLNASPEHVGDFNEGANMDICLVLLNTNLDTIGRYNPSMLLDAEIDTTLQTGRYYLAVEGTSNSNQSDYGSLGSYSIKGSVAISLPVHQLTLTGNVNAGTHYLSWSYQSDEPVKHIFLEAAEDGEHFYPLAQLQAVSKTFSCAPIGNARYYRIRLTTLADEKTYLSNVVVLAGTRMPKPVQLLSALVHDEIVIVSERPGSYHLFDAAGHLLFKGRFVTGTNRIAVRQISKGMFFMRLDNGVAAWTEKLIKQ